MRPRKQNDVTTIRFKAKWEMWEKALGGGGRNRRAVPTFGNRLDPGSIEPTPYRKTHFTHFDG
jgi:hypothetical protein